MATIKGKLKKCKKGYSVILPTKKGEAEFQIPSIAKCFSESDAMDGLEVDVERDVKSCIVKVTIPGKKVIQGTPPPSPQIPISGARGKHYAGSNQTAGSNATAADPKCIGEPSSFTNPYSFIPFPDEAPKREKPTLRSAEEEVGNERFTGVLRLKVKTLSPLMTCEADAYEGNKDSHKKYRALTIGDDVIVPATGIRGSLRTLMTIISGGTLGYMDENLYLCQGRDAQLGPRGKNSPQTVPQNVFLAKIVEPGNATRSGTVELGTPNRLYLVGKEVPLLDRNTGNPILDRNGNQKTKWIDTLRQRPSNGKYIEFPYDETGVVRPSGKPINIKGKREGIFYGTGTTIELPAELWAEYQGRHVHADFPELKSDYLIWLEPTDINATEIKDHKDVKSIQWARWGRHGESLKQALETNHPGVLPDYLQEDGKVDMVTDLFGQVSPKPESEAPIFAGRIRPSNLVFKDTVDSTKSEITLAPLSKPHPGCIAFYRANPDKDKIKQEGSLRGYKVYRTAVEGDKPWEYDTQPVFDGMNAKTGQQKVNKTVQLLPKAKEGDLELAVIGLSKKELSLLLSACSLPWRLGGGKPLGLGLCEIELAEIVNELGERVEASSLNLPKASEAREERMKLWTEWQKPVQKLRYPRAVKGGNKAGLAWFGRHASPKRQGSGLAIIWASDELQQKAGGNNKIAAQILPYTPEELLYGYDCAETVSGQGQQGQNLISNLAPPSKAIPRQGNQNMNQNANTRQQGRDRR